MSKTALNRIQPRAVGGRAAFALLLALAAACSRSGGAGPPDGGSNVDADRDVAVDRPSAGDAPSGDADNGQSCTSNGSCKSGFCVDGFCCNSACDATCMSCKLPSALGICSPIPAGVKPRLDSQCAAGDVSTCGLDGACDGTGQCESYVLGTICKPGQCDGDTVSGTYRCDGAGRCLLGSVMICAPFSCNPATNQCFPTCTSNANCISGRNCLNASCGPKMNGAACTADGECASAHCVDETCCNAACTGACRACNLSNLEGTCSPISKGRTDSACDTQDRSTCGTTGECDGFGVCVKFPANTTICQQATCASATSVTTARTCDGLGTCLASGTESCGTYRCVAGSCKSPCTSNADCADGFACASGSCGVKVDGQTCSADGDCQNGHCVDGVCCNQACAGACRSCSLPGSLGQCTLTASATADPRGLCVAMPPSSCGTDGTCDGAGACRSYPVGMSCGTETCVSDTYTAAPTCDASHQCVRPAATPCNLYHCNGTKCYTSCATSAQCAPPAMCANSSCGLQPKGGPCSTTSQCVAGLICSARDNVCCDTACNGVCETCKAPNLAAGTCSAVQAGAADPSGMCVAAVPATCGLNGLCVGNNTGLTGTQRCQSFGTGTSCRATSCANGMLTAAASCNGTGACPASAVTACGGGLYTCLDATQCRTTCGADTDCIGVACNTISKICGDKRSAGQTCGVDSDCASAHCADGVCCNTACAGACQACNNPGLLGACSSAPDNAADPLCVAAPPCGNTGRCAAGACQKAGAAVTCGSPPSCSTDGSNQFTPQPTCTGAGTCGAPAPVACLDYLCSPLGCPSSCVDNTGCTNGTQCSGGFCVAPAGTGGASGSGGATGAGGATGGGGVGGM